MRFSLAALQPLGRALMLPIAVLPVAALLLRFGQADVLDIPFIAAAGDAIFNHLGMLFAVGVAVGLARENHGAAGLAGLVCFLVATWGARTLIAVPPEVFAGITAPDTVAAVKLAFLEKAEQNFSIAAGILSGVFSGALYNRFSNIKLPDYLAFFGGRRFVPIISGLAGLAMALAFGLGYVHLKQGLDWLSEFVTSSGNAGLFIYGVLNRVLIVTGLHHILNSVVWFLLGNYQGATGDLHRFFAGDPSAGAFMSGFFPVMMFGLPAACLAMYHSAMPARRKAVAGLLFSMALTAFLTGVTEPVEFTFMFLAPGLYALHAVLTGTAMVVMNLLGIKLGFGFSAGFFDYLINFDKATRPLLLLPVGAIYFALYYGLFRVAIRAFDLKTPGREAETESAKAIAPLAGADERGLAYVAALGGGQNLVSVDACTTRLRLAVADEAAVDRDALKALGARGMVRPSPGTLQVVVGPVADQVAGEMRAALLAAGWRQGGVAGGRAAPEPSQVEPPPAQSAKQGITDLTALLEALGGKKNIRAIDTCASRLCINVAAGGRLDEGRLLQLGARAVAKPKDQSVHVILGSDAVSVAERLRKLL